MREKPSFYVALTPIIFMMIVLVVGIGVMGWPASVFKDYEALKAIWESLQGLLSIRFRR